jgi:thioredoxin reductase/bacterioferritin-associated ferredoxin
MRTLISCDEIGSSYDLLVVGAGPAGMSAAIRASQAGVNVLVADENLGPGGQIYRGITSTPVRSKNLLGQSYWKGEKLSSAFSSSSAHYIARCTVWSVNRVSSDAGSGFIINLTREGRTATIEARKVILATGALERPFAIPGWTLPGVMSAGAAQIALKTSGLVPNGPTIVAGSGPLLYLVATQLKAVGANISTILETGSSIDILRGLKYAPPFIASPYFGYGLKILMKARRNFKIVSGVRNLRVNGTDRASSVSYEVKGKSESLECQTMLLHHGVIPNINMSNALGCAQHWSGLQKAWVPTVDHNFQSSVEGIFIAGDGSGIGGAESAAIKGRIAATAALKQIGAISKPPTELINKDRRELAKFSRGRDFLDAVYAPKDEYLVPRSDETIVCRCEEVTAGQIRDTVHELDVQGPNQLKAYLRCGMGPCQGRLCGPTVSAIIAQQRGQTPEDVGYYRLRVPVKPVTIGEIAQSPQSEAAIKAVVRN